MPRNLSSDAISAIAQTTALEPLNVIAIKWNEDGDWYYYADRLVAGTPLLGQLLSLDGLEAVVDINNSGSSTSINIKLNDTDGSIKQIFDYNDIHARPVIVYQWFSNIAFSEKFIIFEGIIASPITWSEGQRNIAFDVITKLEDVQIGFSVEDGDFEEIPEILLGKDWPLVFGVAVNIPALQMDDIPTGTTRIPVGIPDPNIQRYVNYLDTQQAEQAGKASCLSLRGAELEYIGQFGGGGQAIFERGQAMQRQSRNMFNQINNRIAPEKTRHSGILADQKKYDAKIIPIINGHKFKQHTEIEIKIQEARYSGQFDGDNFIVSSRRGPDEPVHRIPQGAALPSNNAFEIVILDTAEEADAQYASLLFRNEFLPLDIGIHGNNSEAYWNCEPPWHTFTPNPLLQKDSINAPKEGKNFFANAGSHVEVGNNYSIRYILSIVPGTVVISLSARHTVNGLKVVDPIPPDYYVISTLTLGSITATIATFSQPLSTIKGQDWENNVFATLSSPVGPNVVDIIIWAIENYSPYTYDLTTFNYVKDKLTNYPANFALLGKKNVVDFLKEIAWQSRCSIWLVNGKFFIKYLPEEAPYIDNVNEDDIDQSTLEITTTQTEDLTTKMIGTWKNDYSISEQYKIIAHYNVPKYGLHENTFDFYIYNSQELVVKSMVFWLIRMSNIWKIIKCKCFLTKLQLETLDSVLVNFARPWVNDLTEEIVGIINRSTFNSEDFSIDMEIWIPVRLGEMRKYVFGYPANIDIDYIFPPIDDQAGGSGSGTIDDARGNLGNGVAYRIVNVPFKRTRPSDRYDSTRNNNIPPVITTTGPYTGGSSTIPQRRLPAYDYAFANVEHARNNVPSITTVEIILGKIISKNEGEVGDISVYTVRLFPNGLNNTNGSIIVENVIDPNDASNLAVDTFVYVMRRTVVNGDNSFIEYTVTGSAGGNAFVGTVVDAIDEHRYMVDVYFEGIDQDPTTTEVLQVQIDASTEIPEGTEVTVIQIGNAYYMQTPVWLTT